jgi:chromodomain-helicase-DNA-binding protein 4
LKNFINRGTSVELLPPNHEDVISARRLQDSSQRADGQAHSSPGRHGRSAAEEENQEQDVYLGLIPDAELRIPSGWKTIDRVLDVLFWKPVVRSKRKAGKGKGKHKAVADSDDEDDDEDSQARAALEDGEEPPTSRMETAEQRKARLRREVTGDDVVDVVWAYVKWQDLGYEQGKLALSRNRV